ncbi:MAG: hypothetical protein EBY17_23190 [Acidobacteriia bacterium]|nr:hypothetical protein [Terriglobia bacterium]
MIDEQVVVAGPADVLPATQFVRVTEELKRAATAALAAFASLHPDDLAEAHMEAVSLKHDGIESAQAVAQAAKHLANFFAQKHWQMQKVHERVEVEADGEHGRVNLPWDLLLPGYFNTLIADAAQTELELLEIDVWLVEAARLFCTTFPTENLIRVDLVPRADECKSDEFFECEKVAPALLKALRGVAAALVKAAVTSPHHTVTITGKEFSELEIKSDEQVVEFGKKNAARRALLALGLLRNRVDFTVEEFATLYLGKPSDEPGKTFNNAMKELRNFLPRLDYEIDCGQRRISRLVFKNVPAEAVIQEILQLLYRE